MKPFSVLLITLLLTSTVSAHALVSIKALRTNGAVYHNTGVTVAGEVGRIVFREEGVAFLLLDRMGRGVLVKFPQRTNSVMIKSGDIIVVKGVWINDGEFVAASNIFFGEAL